MQAKGDTYSFEDAWSVWCMRQRAIAAEGGDENQILATELLIVMKRPMMEWMRANRKRTNQVKEEVVLNVAGQIVADLLTNTRYGAPPSECVGAVAFAASVAMQNLVAMHDGTAKQVNARLLDA
jgi:hypothetical protein